MGSHTARNGCDEAGRRERLVKSDVADVTFVVAGDNHDRSRLEPSVSNKSRAAHSGDNDISGRHDRGQIDSP